jgi:hypothetical protein
MIAYLVAGPDGYFDKTPRNLQATAATNPA